MKKESQEKIATILNGKPLDIVLSDMAPNATGIRALDNENIIALCYSVLRFAVFMSAENASLLVKVWSNGDVPKLEENMAKFYRKVKRIKPNASRGDSAEIFILAREFVGIEKEKS